MTLRRMKIDEQGNAIYVDLTPEEIAEREAESARQEQERAATAYREARRAEYETTFGANWEETMDYIFKNGLDAYIAEKAAIKARHPKP